MGTEALEEIVDEAASRGADGSSLMTRYRTVILGVAVGNALGIPMEGESRGAIRKRWPEGVTEIAPEELHRPWDDDLAQTVLLAQASLRTEDLNLEYLAQEFVRWRDENGRGIGQLTRDVIEEFAAGRPALEAARIVWERSGWSTAGNGAVMRCAPVALRHRRSGAALVRNARTSALVTHYDARCQWSTVVVDVALAAALSDGPPDVERLAVATEDIGARDGEAAALAQLVEAIRATSGAALEDLELDDPMDMGYTLKAMQVALWCLQQHDGFEAVVAGVVAAGGDTDTNGAVAGAALGARTTPDAIPERWLEKVPRTEELVGLADQLYEAGAG